MQGCRTEKVEVIDGEKSVPVIKPPIGYDSNRRVADLPKDPIKAVDSFLVPNGYAREGARERSFTYSLGVYVVPHDSNDERH